MIIGSNMMTRYAGLRGFDLADPIPRLIEDDDKLTQFFEETKIIPYASTNKKTGDSLRILLKQLSKLSTTHAGCIKGKLDYGFTGNIRVEIDGLYTDPVEISNDRYDRYISAMEYINYPVAFLEYLKAVAKNYLIYGEAQVELFIYEHEGKYRLSHNLISPLSGYVILDGNKKKYSYNSNKVTAMEKDGEVTPFFPEFKKHLHGFKSVLHIKNGLGYYGEPDSIDSLLNQYNEFQLKQYNNKQTDNNFMGLTIMEIEKDNPETMIGGEVMTMESSTGEIVAAPAMGVAEKLIQNFTNKGDTPQSIVLFERGYGSRPMEVHTVPPITNEKFFDTMGQINENDIIISHRWSRRLLGMDVSNGLNSTAFMDDFIIKMNTVISDLQRAILAPHDQVNDYVFQLNGNTDLVGLNRRIVNPLQKIFEEKLSKNVSASDTGN